MDRRGFLMCVGGLSLAACTRDAKPAMTPEVQVPLDLSGLEQRFKGRMGLAFSTEGKRGAWRGDERFVYCSSFKLYLAAAMFMRAQAGLDDLNRAVPVTRADMISHAPITEPAVGKSLTLAQLMQGTVETSDNPAANILLREMGGLEVMQQFYRDLGDATTRVDRFEPEMNRLDGDKDTILPSQSVLNLERLFLSDQTPLNQQSRNALLQWMRDTPTGARRIKAGVPEGWGVAHKTGTGGYGPAIDIGLIYPPEAKPIVIAAYFHGSSDSTANGREDAIAEATRMVLAQLGHGQA
jgi:beta-lactamase class A